MCGCVRVGDGIADWRLLEEFTQAASGATEMLKEQRSALEAAEKSPSGSGGALVLTGEEVLLKELQQMRLQLAATQAEKSRLEQDNAELLKNCHFLVRRSRALSHEIAALVWLGGVRVRVCICVRTHNACG